MQGVCQWRNEEDKQDAISWAPSHCWGAKKSTISQVLSSIQYICFRKTSVSNMRAPNLLLPRAPSNLNAPLPFVSRFSEGQYKPRTIGAIIFASLPSISFLCSKYFDWDDGNSFVWRGRCRDWGTTAPQMSVLKSPDYRTNTGAL